MAAMWRKLVILILAVGAAPALGHETDQFTVPRDRKFADLGDFFNRWAYEAIKRGVDVTNVQIREAIAQRKGPNVVAELQSPPHVTMAVRNQWPWSVTQIETFETLLKSPEMRRRYPGRVVAYGDRFAGVYQFAFFPLDVREFAHLFFFSSTIKVYGTYLGTDKLGHFTDEGIAYYFAYRGARDAGASEREAIAKAVMIGTDGFMSERGMLGLAANADYSNGDLSGNFAGFLFYRNLTEAVPLKGEVRQPMLVRDGPYWRLAPDIRPDSGFFARFISDHLDEALNPGFFDPFLRNGMRAAVRARTQTLLQHYCDEHGRPRQREWFDRKLRELSTYWGIDYGHLGRYDELVSIGNSCFDSRKPAAPRFQNDSPGQLAGSVFRARSLAGAQPNPTEARVQAPAADGFGLTSLHLAARRQRGISASDLPSNMAQTNARDAFGCTPLHDAARTGSVDSARRLLACGADPLAADDYGTTPLHLACRRGSIEMVRLLLDHGARVNASSDAGVTPLHEAALAGDAVLVRLLLEHGAIREMRDRRGRTPADVAAACEFGEVVAILRTPLPSLPGGGR